MYIYEIKKVTDSVDWSKIPEIELENRYIDTPKEARAFAKIAYSDEAFHIYMRAFEPFGIRREESGALGEPYHDSCLEFFFCPTNGDSRYLNFEFNSNKCLFVAYGKKLPERARLIVESEELFTPEVGFTADGWEIKYKIPFSFIRILCPDFEAKSGSSIRANFYKCAQKMQPAHFLSWSLIPPEDFTFHKPECFGIMTFGE